MATKIQSRRDTTANWDSVNPVLADGEIGYEKDTKLMKIGDGVLTWSQLEYVNDINKNSINRLLDVDSQMAATEGQVLTRNGTSNEWEARTFGGGGGATQLNELTDVNTSTPTDSNMLIADGVDFESRAFFEDDISNLGTEIVTKTEIDSATGEISMNGGNF